MSQTADNNSPAEMDDRKAYGLKTEAHQKMWDAFMRGTKIALALTVATLILLAIFLL